MNGNCKSVMNMSQADQFELWQSVVKGNMDGYLQVSSRLKLGPVGGDCLVRTSSSAGQPQQAAGETDSGGPTRSCRIPVLLYVRSVGEDIEDACTMDSWDRISYINRPVEIHREEGCNITLESAMRNILPEIFEDEPLTRSRPCIKKGVNEPEETTNIPRTSEVDNASTTGQQEVMPSKRTRIKLIRIQGIELDSQIPFHWVINNLKHPEYYLHICVFIGWSIPSRAR